MSKEKKKDKKKKDIASKPPAKKKAGAKMNVPIEKKPVKKTRDKKPVPKKSKKQTKVDKPSRQKKEKTPKEELCVFAFRLTPQERDLIHRTAGAGRASKFVRGVALAAAKEDEAAFRKILKDACEARS